MPDRRRRRTGSGSAATAADYVLRLDPSTGELVARIELPGPARTIAALENRLLVGLTDENAFVVIDPRTNTVEWNRRVEVADPEPDGAYRNDRTRDRRRSGPQRMDPPD